MMTDSDKMKNGVIGLVGTGIFALLAVLIPFSKILGGFLTYSTFAESLGVTVIIDFYWDQIEASTSPFVLWLETSNTQYDTFIESGNSKIYFIWQLIPTWGLAWIVFGLIGAVLVMIPAIQQLMGRSLSDIGFFGLVAGLLGTMVEIGLFLAAWLLEDWDATLGVTPDLNIILLGCFVIGWISLIVGYVFGNKGKRVRVATKKV